MTAILLSSLLLCEAEPGFQPPRMNGMWEYEWIGFMGISLFIKDDTFEYWMYSDVGPDETEYPIRGKVVYKYNSIQLVPAKNEHLYSTTWRLIVHEGEICLLADHDLPNHRPPKFPSSRLFHKTEDDEPSKSPSETK